MTRKNIKKTLIVSYLIHFLFIPYIYIETGSIWAILLFEIAMLVVLVKAYFLSLYMYRRSGQLKD